MVNIERELDRYLTLLRNMIRDQGFTQLEVQAALGWGRSYISQLVTKQKSLRLEQILDILHVVGVEPGAFFGELYGPPSRLGDRQWQSPGSGLPHQELQRLTFMFHGLTELLRQKGLITESGLKEAVEARRREPG